VVCSDDDDEGEEQEGEDEDEDEEAEEESEEEEGMSFGDEACGVFLSTRMHDIQPWSRTAH